MEIIIYLHFFYINMFSLNKIIDMARYIRYKKLKQQINFLNCDNINNWIDTCNIRLNGFFDVCNSNCSCSEYGENEPIPQYRYKELNPNYSYYCENNNRYYKIIKEVSYDDGKTWYKVTPEEIIKGDLYESNSKFCISESIKIEWFSDGSEQYCDGLKLIENQIKKVSFDNGKSWEDLIWNKKDGTIFKETRKKIIDSKSCDCGYKGVDYFFDGEYICGSELGTSYISTSKYEIWIEKDVCTLEPTGNIEYRNPKQDCDCGYKGVDYIFNGEYICGYELGNQYDSTSKYEIWREKDVCTLEPTGNVEYRNPKQDCDCGYKIYKWVPDLNDTYADEYNIQYVKYYLYELCPDSPEYNVVIDERYSMYNTLLRFDYFDNGISNYLFNAYNLDYIQYVIFNGVRYEKDQLNSLKENHSGTLEIKINDMCNFIPISVSRINNLKTAIIGNGITVINEESFMFCSGLTEVIMSDDVISVGKSSFYACSNLTKVTLSKSLNTISQNSFQSCNLQSIEFPKSIKEIDRESFSRNPNLNSITCLAKEAPKLELAYNVPVEDIL